MIGFLRRLFPTAEDKENAAHNARLNVEAEELGAKAAGDAIKAIEEYIEKRAKPVSDGLLALPWDLSMSSTASSPRSRRRATAKSMISAEGWRTSILPVTTAEMSAARRSFRRPMSFSASASNVLNRLVSAVKNSAMRCCSSIGMIGRGTSTKCEYLISCPSRIRSVVALRA